MMKRPFARIILATVVALLCGCASSASRVDPPPPGGLGRVAVVASPLPATTELEGYARSRAQGAAQAFGDVFEACVIPNAFGPCSGTGCAAAYAVFLGICTAVSGVGGVVGALRTEDPAALRAQETSIHGAVDQSPVQEALRDAVARALAARGHAVPIVPAGAVPAGVETLLEVGVTQVGTVGRGIKAPVTLHLIARARLLRASDGSELYAADFEAAGERHPLGAWAADGGALLAAGLEAGYLDLAAQIAGRFAPALESGD